MANNTDEKTILQGVPEGTTEGQSTTPEGSNDSKKAGDGKKADKPKKADKVPYMIPLNVLSDDTHHTVIYKGKPYQIECGVEVNIPPYIAEILDNALKQRKAANALTRDLSM